MMVAACEEMSQLVCEQDGQQRSRKRKAHEEAGWIFVEKREAVQERVNGCGLIVRIGDGELSSRYKTRAKSQQEKHDGKSERFLRRTWRNLRVIPLANEIVVPVQAFGER